MPGSSCDGSHSRDDNGKDDDNSPCPLCLEPFSPADIAYPLDCPNPKCGYRFCGACLDGLRAAAAEDYQEASDGSMQVKIHVACPQCRAKYEIPQNAKLKTSVVLESVTMLRTAYMVERYLGMPDNQLPAKDLSKKNEFISKTSMEDMKDAVRRFQTYHDEIQKRVVIPLPNWDLWRPLIPPTRSQIIDLCSHFDSPAVIRSRSQTSQQSLPPWRDPTLFFGLEDLMTAAEQECVTDLMVSGQVDQVVQAAQILNAILDVSYTRQDLSLREWSGYRGSNASPSLKRWKQKTVDLQLMQIVRRKYPLPTRMPRCVRFPVGDQHQSSYSNPQRNMLFGMQFPSNNPKGLTLTAVKGPAGRVGLRRGDIVTHVLGNSVHSQEECWFQLEEWTKKQKGAQVQQQQQEKGNSDVIFFVNCDVETAQALKRRSKMMQDNNVDLYV